MALLEFNQWILAKEIKFLINLILVLWSLGVNASDLKVLMLKDESKPYAENASGDVLSTFNKAVLGQLLLTTNSFELQAGLLKDWKWSAKDGSYELFLRENLSFHDGSAVKSEDLEFALLRGFFSKQRSFYEIYLGNILGVDKITPGTKYSSGLVEGVKITGPYSIKVKLKNPNPSFLYALTRPYFSFSKKSALNDDLITWKKWPIGAGAFRIESEDEEKITLKKRDDSLKGINQIVLYKKNNLAIMYDISFFPTLQKMKLFKTKDPSAIFTLFFTNQNELSSNRDFRKAIKYGVDKNELIDGDELSKPAFEFLPSTFWKNDSSINVFYDLSKAKSHFLKIPENLRSKIWRIPVFSFGEFSEERKRINGKLKEQFARFGFKVEFYPSSEKFLSKESATESPFGLSGRVCNNVDPLLMFSSFQTKSPYKYDNAQNDSDYDALFNEASKAVSTEQRVETLRKLSRYTIEHDFMVPLYENDQSYYFNPDTVESFGD